MGYTDMNGLCKRCDAFFSFSFFCSQGQAEEMKIGRREPRKGKGEEKRGT